MNKQYIGDSVYVEFDGERLVLTTDNGDGPNTTIFLELEVYEQLVSYAAQYFAASNMENLG